VKSTTRFNKNKRGIECLNCKQPISDNDNFCSNCGQVNDELPLSIKQFVSEFFSGFFSFDTRFFKTFIPLIFKPGKVSKDYIKGKRRRYVNPFQLYLHVTILFFLVVGLFTALDKYNIIEDTIDNISKNTTITSIDSLNNNNELTAVFNDSITTLIKDSIHTEIKSTDNTITEKIRTRIDSIFNITNFLSMMKNSEFSDKERDSIYLKYNNENIAFISQNLLISDVKNLKELQNFPKYQEEIRNYTIEKLESNGVTYTPQDSKKAFSSNFEKTVFKKISDFMDYDKKHKNAKAIEALDSLNYEKTRWNVYYYKKAQDINKLRNDEGQIKNYLEKVFSKISIALFFLLPVFTLFLALIYFRHKRNYTEHLVFVFNIQTVFFLLLLFSFILNRLVNTDIEFIISMFVLIFLFYLYKSLRNFYKQGRLKTIIKFILLNFAYFFLATIGTIIISFITFAL
jgi:hypothetical protein